MYADKKQSVVESTCCWFGSHSKSQQMSYNRKIRQEEDLIHPNGDGEKRDSGTVQEVE